MNRSRATSLRFTISFLLLSVFIIACPGNNGTTPPPPTSNNGPQFVINSPLDGSKIAGTLFFSVQPFDVTNISSVTFKVGGTELATDTTADDGFRTFLAASEYPEGDLELTAIVTGKNGALLPKPSRLQTIPIRHPPQRLHLKVLF